MVEQQGRPGAGQDRDGGLSPDLPAGHAGEQNVEDDLVDAGVEDLLPTGPVLTGGRR
jgi:hypothetical protein